jgi:hypothetical protein
VFRLALEDMPLPIRFAVVGLLIIGLVGGGVGLVVGLHANVQKASAALSVIADLARPPIAAVRDRQPMSGRALTWTSR